MNRRAWNVTGVSLIFLVAFSLIAIFVLVGCASQYGEHCPLPIPGTDALDCWIAR